MEDSDNIRLPAAEDRAMEAAVLRQLLALHPVQLSFDDVLREVIDDPGDFGQRDSVARAVRDLVAAGLAHRNGQIVLPSRAALRCEELLD